MANKQSDGSGARCGAAIICFLIVILGQVWLLRNLLFGGSFGSLPTALYIEMLFWIPLIAGIVICWVRPMGWGRKIGCIIALALFILYLVFSVLQYSTLAEAYLTGFDPEFESAGRAMVGFKLVLTLIGVTAGMPAGPQIDPREYSRRLREKTERQEAEWAKASVKGARKDLKATVDRLRGTLSDEELAELLAELQKPVTDDEPEQAPSSPRNDENNVTEKWRGWGGGM